MDRDERVAEEILNERRQGRAPYYIPENVIADSKRSVLSPSGHYRLDIQRYRTGPQTWDVSRGIVLRTADNIIIADIKRNYGAFWNAWVNHPNGNEYLLCGEDYQGYTVVNLTQGFSDSYLPVRALQGWGFCWANVLPSPDGMTLAVEGCYWACPYDLVFYDFSQPDCLPLPELRRFEGLERVIGWENANTFAFTCGYEIRKADGAKYNSLPAEEQDELDADPNLRADIEEQLRWTKS